MRIFKKQIRESRGGWMSKQILPLPINVTTEVKAFKLALEKQILNDAFSLRILELLDIRIENGQCCKLLTYFFLLVELCDFSSISKFKL
jgi:hypothetical protein